MPRVPAVAACAALALIAACGRPDGRALQKLACEQVASSIDLQSVSQIDALRKALGVAPDVDPLQTCRDLGVTLDSRGPGSEAPGQGEQEQGGESGEKGAAEAGSGEGGASDNEESGGNEEN